MKSQIRIVTVTAVLLASALLARPAMAQSSSNWEFRAGAYAYFPWIDGTTAFPTPLGDSISVDAGTLVKNTRVAAMGTFEAQKGRFGAFVDAMYFNINNSESGTREFDIAGMPLPPGVTADATFDLKATVLTFAGNVRAVSTRRIKLDVFGGTRMLDVRGDLDWKFNTDFGPFSGPARQGASQATNTMWDGIGGAKGRVNLSENFFVPYYGDIGAGQSDLTWQASAGLGYSIGRRIEIIGAYRYLDYKLPTGKKLESLSFNGPAVGISYRF